MQSTAMIEGDRGQLRKGQFYRPELDALRFFAFLCVFFLHTETYIKIDPTQHLWLSRIRMAGTYGVPIFFLLSAYLIT